LKRGENLPFSLDPLEPNFVPAKPKNSVKDSVVKKVEDAGNLLITRKRDGYCHLAVKTSDRIRLYTRGIALSSRRSDKVREAFQKHVASFSRISARSRR